MTKRIVLLNESSTTQLLNAVHYDIETSVNLISTVVLLSLSKTIRLVMMLPRSIYQRQLITPV
jgi:hypothetical protein